MNKSQSDQGTDGKRDTPDHFYYRGTGVQAYQEVAPDPERDCQHHDSKGEMHRTAVPSREYVGKESGICQNSQQENRTDKTQDSGPRPMTMAASLPLKPWAKTSARSIRFRRGVLGT